MKSGRAYLAWSTRHRPELVTSVGNAPVRSPDGVLREGFILRAANTPLGSNAIADVARPDDTD